MSEYTEEKNSRSEKEFEPAVSRLQNTAVWAQVYLNYTQSLLPYCTGVV